MTSGAGHTQAEADNIALRFQCHDLTKEEADWCLHRIAPLGDRTSATLEETLRRINDSRSRSVESIQLANKAEADADYDAFNGFRLFLRHEAFVREVCRMAGISEEEVWELQDEVTERYSEWWRYDIKRCLKIHRERVEDREAGTVLNDVQRLFIRGFVDFTQTPIAEAYRYGQQCAFVDAQGAINRYMEENADRVAQSALTTEETTMPASASTSVTEVNIVGEPQEAAPVAKPRSDEQQLAGVAAPTTPAMEPTEASVTYLQSDEEVISRLGDLALEVQLETDVEEIDDLERDIGKFDEEVFDALECLEKVFDDLESAENGFEDVDNEEDVASETGAIRRGESSEDETPSRHETTTEEQANDRKVSEDETSEAAGEQSSTPRENVDEGEVDESESKR